MSEPFVGEIRMFAGNFAPRGWALCDGQLLPVSQNDALFSLLGTIYGGDGRTTFAVPDMRGRLPVHYGSGPGLTPRPIGQRTGSETVTLTLNQIPSHTHTLQASTTEATAVAPAGQVLGTTTDGFYEAGSNPVNMSAQSIGSAGGQQDHTNLMASLCVNFIISLFGIYPSRS